MSLTPQGLPTLEDTRAIARIGFWSAVLTTLWAVAFTAAFAAEAVTSPPSVSWQGLAAYAASFRPVSMALVILLAVRFRRLA